MRLSNRKVLAAVFALPIMLSMQSVFADECGDTVVLSGDGKGCASYTGAIHEVDMSHCGFTKTPMIKIEAFTAALQDTLLVKVRSKSKAKFSVLIQSQGRNGAELCANSSFSWTATEYR